MGRGRTLVIVLACGQPACGELLGVDPWKAAPGAVSTGGSGGAGASGGAGGAGGAGGGIDCTEWGVLLGGPGESSAHGVAVQRSSGGVVVLGEFTQTMAVGDELLVSTNSGNSRDLYVATFDAVGVPAHGVAFGGGDVERAGDVALTDGGDIVITGGFLGSFAFGGDVVTSMGTVQDVFAASLDPTGEAVSFAFSFGDDEAQKGVDVAVSPVDGSVVLVGTYEGDGDFGLGMLGQAGAEAAFLGKFTPPSLTWATSALGDDTSATGVAIDDDGSIVVAGRFATSVSVGAETETGANDVWIAKLDDRLSPMWMQRFGSDGDALFQEARDVAIGPDGEILMVGKFTGLMPLGAQALTAIGGYDGFVVKLSGEGIPIWSARIGGLGNTETLEAVAVDSDGNVYVTGQVHQDVDLTALGGDVLIGASVDAFVAAFSPGGSLLWARRLNDDEPPNQVGLGVAPHPCGVLVVGETDGAIDLGQGEVASAGGTDAFVALLLPPKR